MLDAIENEIYVITIDTTVDMEITCVDSNNTGVRVETTVVVIKTPGVQYTLHEDNNNEGEDDDTSKIADEYIPEEDVHDPQLTSPNKLRI